MLLLFHTLIYWLYKRRSAHWDYLFLLNIITFVDLASVILVASIFSWKIAVAYVVVGIILAITGETIINNAKNTSAITTSYHHSNGSTFAENITLSIFGNFDL